MARSKDQYQYAFGYRLFTDGVRSAPAIASALFNAYGDEAKTERTVRGWIVEYKELMERTSNVDEPFEWHRMGEYGFSWQDGEWFLAMWKARLETAATVWKMSQTQLPPPTVRNAQWWWRVHQAAPELTDIDVHSVASAYERRELRKDLGGEKFYAADLNAFLAFKPWLDDLAAETYEGAVASGFIPKVRFDSREQTLDLAAHLAKTDWRPEPGEPWPADIAGLFLTLDTHVWPAGGDTTPEWLLPSQVIEAWARHGARTTATNQSSGAEDQNDG